MKKVLVVFGFAAISAMAADVTGYHHGQELLHQEGNARQRGMRQALHRRGAAAVLATEDGKIYAISNQDKVKDAAGKKVTVTGKVEGDSITVDSVKM